MSMNVSCLNDIIYLNYQSRRQSINYRLMNVELVKVNSMQHFNLLMSLLKTTVFFYSSTVSHAHQTALLIFLKYYGYSTSGILTFLLICYLKCEKIESVRLNSFTTVSKIRTKSLAHNIRSDEKKKKKKNICSPCFSCL